MPPTRPGGVCRASFQIGVMWDALVAPPICRKNRPSSGRTVSRGPGPLAPSQAEASHRAQRQHGYANSEPTGPSIGPRRRQATRNIREDGSPGDRCRQPFRYTPGTQWTPDRDPSCGDFSLLGGSHTGSPTVHPCPFKATTYAIVGNTFTHYPKWIIGIRLPDLGLASSQGRSCPRPTTRRFSL